MYVPRHFSQDDTAVAHDLIRSNVFATLVIEVSGRLDAAHLPVVLDAERGRPMGSKIQRENFLLSLNSAHRVSAEGFEAVGKMLCELDGRQRRSPENLAE